MAAHRKLAAALAGALVLLLIVAFVAAQARGRLQESTREVIETYEIIAAMNGLLSHVVDAETGQRGFVLTGDASYIPLYRRATAQIDADAADLKARVRDDELRTQLGQVLLLIDRRLAILQATMEVRRSEGLEEAASVARSSGGREAMEALRTMVETLVARERDRLGDRLARTSSDVARADVLVTGTAILGAIVLAALIVLLGREIRFRNAREESLSEHVAITDGVLASMSDAVVVADRTGQIMLMNEAARRRLPRGQTRAGDPFGGDRPVLFRGDGITPIPRDEAPLVLALQGKTTRDLECLYRPPSGETAWFTVSARPIADTNGVRTGAVSVFRDVTKAKQSSLALQHANARLQSSVDQLQSRHNEMALLGQLSHLLRSCGTISEACALATKFLARLCPGGSGAIYLVDDTSLRFARATAWGRIAHLSQELGTNDCWALRRQLSHSVDPQAIGLLCGHVASDVLSYICVPMTAPGECLGMVYVEAATAGRTAGALPGPGILEAVAQEVCLTLANLRLRDMLLQHSVRDPLTGLCNRRVLDEWFDRELARATRHGTSVGVLLIDVDHFKRFNDSFGHEAGDAMLQALATMLREAVRTEDLVCRYGGEEFLLILGDTSAEHVARRAADLCRRARELEVHDASRRLPPVTLSIGVAVAPQHAAAADALLRAADRALYAAKEAGRDRVEVARSVQPAAIVAA